MVVTFIQNIPPRPTRARFFSPNCLFTRLDPTLRVEGVTHKKGLKIVLHCIRDNSTSIRIHKLLISLVAVSGIEPLTYGL